MKYPDSFNQVKKRTVKDEISNFSESFKKGMVEYSYTKIIKITRLSCSTIFGIYQMCAKAPKKRYHNTLPVRKQKIAFRNSITEAVTDIIPNIISHIPEVTKGSEFKEISDNVTKNSLLDFNADINRRIRFTGIDNNKSIYIVYNQIIPPKPEMQKCISISAFANKKNKFKNL